MKEYIEHKMKPQNMRTSKTLMMLAFHIALICRYEILVKNISEMIDEIRIFTDMSEDRITICNECEIQLHQSLFFWTFVVLICVT